MKQLYLFLACFFSILFLNAQTPEFYFNGSADVIFKYPPRGSGGRAFVHDDGNVLTLNYGGDFTGGTRIGNNFNLANNGIAYFYSWSPIGAAQGDLYVDVIPGTRILRTRNWNEQSPNVGATGFLTGSGYFLDKVGIGTQNPTETLSVNGKIRAKEIKVETANWPDYVFDESYQLPDLKETEHFIKTNKHLPGIPSAKEVEKDGISLGEMNAKLLKKIEELTLHLIAKEVKMNQMEVLLQELSLKIDELKAKP